MRKLIENIKRANALAADSIAKWLWSIKEIINPPIWKITIEFYGGKPYHFAVGGKNWKDNFTPPDLGSMIDGKTVIGWSVQRIN